MAPVEIAGREVGLDAPPFVIAEMSGNHNQSLDRALEIVDAAAESGAHALKLQTYTPDTMTLDVADGDFYIDDPHSLWHGRSLYELYEEAHTPWDWHEPIFDRCRERGLVCFSTPFDSSAVEFLEKLDVPCYKIASFENTDMGLLECVAKTGRPVIMSTGMATLSELGESVGVLRAAGCRELVLLKCTSSYPATPEFSNIKTIPQMREVFDCEVGLSDHTLGLGVATAAIALGATVIEKHFTLSRDDGGVDAAFSVDADEMRDLVAETERAWKSLGGVAFGPGESEAGSLRFRRSLYIAEDMHAGDTLTARSLRAVRPGYGLPSRYYEVLLGKKVNRDISKGTAATWDMIG